MYDSVLREIVALSSFAIVQDVIDVVPDLEDKKVIELLENSLLGFSAESTEMVPTRMRKGSGRNTYAQNRVTGFGSRNWLRELLTALRTCPVPERAALVAPGNMGEEADEKQVELQEGDETLPQRVEPPMDVDTRLAWHSLKFMGEWSVNAVRSLENFSEMFRRIRYCRQLLSGLADLDASSGYGELRLVDYESHAGLSLQRIFCKVRQVIRFL